jgi:hypothetical protein
VPPSDLTSACVYEIERACRTVLSLHPDVLWGSACSLQGSRVVTKVRGGSLESSTSQCCLCADAKARDTRALRNTARPSLITFDLLAGSQSTSF